MEWDVGAQMQKKLSDRKGQNSKPSEAFIRSCSTE